MKTVFTMLLLVIPTTLLAADPPKMDQGAMQNMTQVMQQVQECMQKIDQNQMQQLQVQSQTFEKEIDALCAAGKRDAAQQQAIKRARELSSNPALEQMQKCGEIAQGALPMMEGIGAFDEKEYETTHVCDK